MESPPFSPLTIITLLFSVLLVKPLYAVTTTQPGPTLEMSYYSSSEDASLRFILVEKAHQRLTLYEQGATLTPLRVFQCATGENSGVKLTSGDSRTPEGIYFITEIYQDTKVTVFGDRAFHLDYPNIFDQQEGRRGDGIYLHGTDKALTPYSTNGCVSMKNQEIKELAPYLALSRVPVIIVDSLSSLPMPGTPMLQPENPRFATILNKLSFSTQTMPLERIQTLLYIRLGKKAVARIEYGALDGEFTRYRYHKKVYLAPGISSPWRIVQTEEAQEPVPVFLARQPTKLALPPTADATGETVQQPAIASSVPAVVTSTNQAQAVPPEIHPVPSQAIAAVPAIASREERLLQFVENWRQAWTEKNIDAYMACYSPTFTKGKLDWKGWQKKKSRLNRIYSYIQVNISNIVVEWIDTGARVSFYQDYESDRYTSKGTKSLILSEKDGTWHIEKEIM